MLDLAKVVLTLLLGPGGVVIAWLTLRHKGDPLPQREVTHAEVIQAAEESGLVDRWKAYSDEMEERLNARIDRLEKELEEERATTREMQRREIVHFTYEARLEAHIEARRGPPAPTRPEDINPMKVYYYPRNNNE